MNRILGALSALLLGLLVLVPVVAAADPIDEDGRIVISVRGDITFPAGEVADSLVVVDGTATIEGDVASVFAFNSTVLFVGSRSHDVVAVASRVAFDGRTVITGEVRVIGTTVDQAPGAVIEGGVRDGIDVTRGALFIAPALLFVYIGFVIAAVAAGLALAGFASRQVRSAERVISREPVTTILAGLAGLFTIMAGAVLAMVTVIGIPMGLGMLIGFLPVLLFAGYLVTGIWLGEWILRRVSAATAPERPYLAAIVGILLLGMVSMIPGIGGLVGFVGFGAIVLLMWRALRRHPASDRAVGSPVTVPSGA